MALVLELCSDAMHALAGGLDSIALPAPNTRLHCFHFCPILFRAESVCRRRILPCVGLMQPSCGGLMNSFTVPSASNRRLHGLVHAPILHAEATNFK
eukprot:6181206-Pleurochrysis_carterae.AAC.6